MLKDDTRILYPDPILDMIARINGNGSTVRLQEGVYQVGHFGGSNFPGLGYKDWIEDFDAYGVADSVEQILSAYPALEAEGREFVLTLTPVVRANQSPDGGWRWHKWGPYIGAQNPQHEYLHDDTHIDKVLVFHIYEREAA